MILGIVICSITAKIEAQDYSSRNNTQNNRMMAQGIEVPKNTGAINQEVVRNRFEMSTTENAKAYKEAQIRKTDRMRILNEVFDPAILMAPVKRTIRPVDTIGISPTYISQIVFPDTMKIQDATASFACHVLEYSRNLLRIRPDANTFFSGNIVLTLTDGKKNYAMTIFAERYFQEDCRIDNGEYICRKKRGLATTSQVQMQEQRSPTDEDAYAYAYNNLSSFYVYTNPKKIDDMEAFLLYERLSGKVLDIEEENGQVTFKYEGIYYIIIRDEISGTISYRGKQYRVVPRG
ncbi:MAG TPA: hypothetical protein ENN12_04315 [Epsilonproteobacteria bacterium]|nr:hypothetical protein [Campylobacterota bacterium]